MVEILRTEMSRIAPEYSHTERQYIKNGLNGLNRKWCRLFVYSLPIFSMIDTASKTATENQGVGAMLFDTILG
jgi:hypothetical protein